VLNLFTSCVNNLSLNFVTACIADIVFVIDNSGSIRDNDLPGGNNWQLIIDFVKSIIEMFTIAPDITRIAVVDFGRYYYSVGIGILLLIMCFRNAKKQFFEVFCIPD